MLERQCEVVCSQTREDGWISRKDALAIDCSHCEFKKEKRPSFINLVLRTPSHIVGSHLEILFVNWNRISHSFQFENNWSRCVYIACKSGPAISKLKHVSTSVTSHSSLCACAILNTVNLRPCGSVDTVKLPTSYRKDQIHSSSHRIASNGIHSKLVSLGNSSNFVITGRYYHFCNMLWS